MTRRLENQKVTGPTFRDRIQFEPKTEFGKEMMRFRRAIEASGEVLLTLEEINSEVRRRRGEEE